MATGQSIKLSITVFAEDCPELFAFAAGLPASKQRRAHILLTTLQRGLRRLDGSNDQVGGATGDLHAVFEHRPAGPSAQPVEPQAAGIVEPPSAEPRFDLEDLNEVFGKQSHQLG